MAVQIEVTTYKMEMRTTPGTCYQRGEWIYESQKRIDHDNSSDRKWLGSHCFWAARNGRRVVSTPIGQSYAEYIEMGRSAR